MNKIKKYLFHFLFTTIIFIIFFVLLTTLYHFNIISNNIYQIGKLLILLFLVLISSIILGKKASNRGYLEGLKLGIFVITLFFIMILLTNSEIKIRLILYDTIILITSILGGMIGINKKINKQNNLKFFHKTY